MVPRSTSRVLPRVHHPTSCNGSPFQLSSRQITDEQFESHEARAQGTGSISHSPHEIQVSGADCLSQAAPPARVLLAMLADVRAGQDYGRQ